MSQELTPFVYSSLTDFLKAARQGSRGQPLAMAVWAKRLGYKSSRSLEMVVAGDRLPSREMTDRLAEDLKLGPGERQYLELMIQREKRLREGRPVLELEKRMTELRPEPLKIQHLDNEVFRRVAEWYPIVIRELTQTPGFRRDLEWIRKRLREKVTSSQIASALAEWEGLALDPMTFYTPEDIPSQAVRGFHKKMLQKAIEAIDEVDVSEREYISITFKSSAEKLPELKEKLRELRDQFLKDFDQADGAEVMQLNLVLFPHSRLKAPAKDR